MWALQLWAFLDSGLVVVIFICLGYLLLVFALLFFVKNEWCDLLFKNMTVGNEEDSQPKRWSRIELITHYWNFSFRFRCFYSVLVTGRFPYFKFVTHWDWVCFTIKTVPSDDRLREIFSSHKRENKSNHTLRVSSWLDWCDVTSPGEHRVPPQELQQGGGAEGDRHRQLEGPDTPHQQPAETTVEEDQQSEELRARGRVGASVGARLRW